MSVIADDCESCAGSSNVYIIYPCSQDFIIYVTTSLFPLIYCLMLAAEHALLM